MLTITDEVLAATKMTATQLQQELAVFLYAKNKLSFGQAKKLAMLDVLQFQELLFNNNVPINYDIKDFEDDLKAAREYHR